MKASEDQVSGNHYKKYAIQPAEFIQKNGLNWCEGNAIKYLVRHRDKKGAEDLRKAKHYIDLLLEWEYPEPPAASLCHSCHIPKCDKPLIERCEMEGVCAQYVPEAKQCDDDCGQVGESCTNAGCRHYSTLFMRNCQAYNSKEIIGCAGYQIGAKQEAPTAAEQPAPHTDPAVNCKKCCNTICQDTGRDVTLDLGCSGYKPKGAM